MILLRHLMITCNEGLFHSVTPPRNRIGKYLLLPLSWQCFLPKYCYFGI